MEYEINILPCERYFELKDVFDQQQQFHFDLGGPYSKRFLEITIKEFINFMEINEKIIDSVVYILEHNNKIIGFVAGTIDNDKKGNILDLSVQQEYRSKGYGKKLFETLLNWFNENNIKNIDIHVSVGNEKVLKFYEEFGFKVTGYTMKKITE